MSQQLSLFESPTPVYDQSQADAALGRLVRALPAGLTLVRLADDKWCLMQAHNGKLLATDCYPTPEQALRAGDLKRRGFLD